MTVVTWTWRDRVMKDYYLFSWLHFSKHFEDVKIWSYEFHWKDSNVWYYNFKRQAQGSRFKRTRLTLRLGKHIISIGSIDTETYYKDVVLLKMVCKGKVVFEVKPDNKYAEAIVRSAELLNKAYPGRTWRN
jgi:hypothetical protein